MDMSNTMVVSVTILSSSSSPSTSSVGIPHPPMKHKCEDNLTSNGGWKKGSPSSREGFALACIILVTEASLTSLEFLTVPLDEVNGGSQVPPSSPAQLTHDTPVKCMFNSIDDVPNLSVIFARSMNFTLQGLSEGNLEVPSSLALVIRESEGAPLAIPPLQACFLSPYNDLDWENNDLLVDED